MSPFSYSVSAILNPIPTARPTTRRALAAFAVCILCCALPNRADAEIRIMEVSREKAKELGISVRSSPTDDSRVRVQVDFKSAGALTGYRYADLDLSQGERQLASAAILARKPAADASAESQRLEFYVDPVLIPGSTVTIVAYPAPRGGVGYRLRLRDFLPVDAPRQLPRRAAFQRS